MCFQRGRNKQHKSVKSVKTRRVSADILAFFIILYWLQKSRNIEGVKQKPKENKASLSPHVP